MLKFPLIVASVAALLTFAASAPASAQSQSNSSQSVPDAPKPQKKPPAKPDTGSQTTDKTTSQPPASDAPADKPAPKGSSAKDDNPFPEQVSKQAAKAAAGSSDSDHPAEPAPGTPKPSTAADNPFPESVSRDAAKAAGNDPAPAAKPDIPPGYSSSRSGPANGLDHVADPVRAKKDAEVGSFYLNSGDYQGALLRYQDATSADPTNVDAIFGLAETQRRLKKNADAARNYQLYLEIVPNGPKSKQALKALKTLGSGG
jgi:tetratricopeptide (TPR) repeat protein